MEKEWKSPRKIKEELLEYKMERFEDYMQRVDRGELERELAFTAMREEFEYVFSEEGIIGAEPK